MSTTRNIYKFMVLLIVSVSFTNAQKKFSIGAIFESDKDDSEIAFRTAVERANIYERKIELVPIIVYTSSDDSFIVEKVVCNLISQGVIAIYGPSTGISSDIVASICNTLEIPHFIYDWRQSEALEDRLHSTMTLNVYPDTVLLAGGLADIVQDFTWRSFTMVYETEKELQQLQNVLQIVNPNGNPITVRQLDEGPDYRPFLKSIKVSSDNCIVLHCKADKVVSILRQANDLNMLTEYLSIFMPVLDTHTIAWMEFKDIAANITTVRLMDPTDFQVKNVAHDWEEHEKREGRYYRVSSDEVKTNMILANDAVWILSKGLAELDIFEELKPPTIECKRNKPWPFGRRIIEFIRARSTEAATGRIDFNEHGERSFFTIRLMELTSTGFVDLATWDPVNKLAILSDEEESEKRAAKKFANKTLTVTSRKGAPFLSLREPKEGEILEGNARYEGYSVDLIDAIAKLLNIKYEIQLAPDNGYGSYDPVKKEWNGLIKQLLDGNADIGICDLTMTSIRRQTVDFTPPFMTLGISILYARPETPPPDLYSFLSPFSLEVWLYMATAYLGVSFLIYGISRMAPEDWENPHPCKEPEELENVWILMNTTWLTMGSLMGQGCDLLPKAASTRLVTGMWWFFALMMLNSYTANLAAFLTMSRMGSTIKSAEELAAQSKIKYGTLKGGSTMGFFENSNFSTYQRMWSAMSEARPSVFTTSNDEGIERVAKEKGNYAYLMESTVLEYIIERKCELMQVGGWLDYKTYGIAMPFNSPYRKQISGAVLRLGELGTLAELKRKWWKEMHGGGKCSQVSDTSSDTPELKLDNVGGVFLVLGIGLCCSILIGLSEFLWNVKSVAIEEKISLKEALKAETMFALKFWITTKPANTSKSSSSSSSSSSSLRTKRSSKTLAISRSHSPKSLKSVHTIDHNVRLSVHEKLRKISSVFSIKSLRSEPEHAVELNVPIPMKDEHLPTGQPNRILKQNQDQYSNHRNHQKKLSADYNGGSEPFA